MWTLKWPVKKRRSNNSDPSWSHAYDRQMAEVLQLWLGIKDALAGQDAPRFKNEPRRDIVLLSGDVNTTQSNRWSRIHVSVWANMLTYTHIMHVCIIQSQAQEYILVFSHTHRVSDLERSPTGSVFRTRRHLHGQCEQDRTHLQS